MAKRSLAAPSKHELLQLLDYDPGKGSLTSKTGATTYVAKGILLIRLGEKVLQVKRAIWFLETGLWTTNLLVHKNNNPMDCRFGNLMELIKFSEPPTREEVAAWYEYSDGKLLSRTSYKKLKAGEVGSTSTNYYGYKRTGRLGREYLVHRLIFLLMTGEWPEQIDHIDGDKTNNRIENLRAANSEINGKNRKLNVKSSTGQNGVHMNKKNGRYRVVISVNKKFKNMGEFDSLEEAVEYRKRLEKKHGYAAAHNRE